MNDTTIPILQELQNLAGTGGFQVIDNLGTFVTAIVGLALTVAAIATLIYLVWGGIRWLTAGPDKGKTEEARTQITNAIIGLTIVAASWAVFLLLNYFFGLGIASGAAVGSSSGAGTGGIGTAGNGLCSTSSAAQCQGGNPGDSCHNGNQVCVALSNQTGPDGKVLCTCR